MTMALALACLAIVLGGIMKGAIGAGVPVIAAPALTMLFDVQTAVAILVVPNLLSNVVQGWTYRRQAMPPRFLALFAGGAMAGVVVGSWLLAVLSKDVLSLFVVAAVVLYIALRIARPGWVLKMPLAQRLAAPAGALGGLLQGATGISAPASITFLNAMRLGRETFIGTISIYFLLMTAMQIPALWGLGILTGERLAQGFAALALVLLSMPFVTWLGKRARPEVFDRIMLGTLAVLSAKMLYDVVA
ncbi:MAG TPA: sulfite exporter TauE/SafE family protein [Paracoccaceae bacterium]|nr:sulfite exporter TauE/SafE family protein [Paracoccaceae bacterium]